MGIARAYWPLNLPRSRRHSPGGTRQGPKPNDQRCSNRRDCLAASRHRVHSRQGFFPHRPLDRPLAASLASTLSQKTSGVLHINRALRNSSPYQPSTPAFSIPSRSIRTLTKKVIDKPFTSVLLSFVFPSSDHGLASSSPRNLCTRRLPRHPRLLRLCRGTSWGPGPGAGACPELLGALDSSFLGLTLNLQLSTFNRVSFPSPSSPHLCALCVLRGENSSSFRSSLIPRHSPLTTNSFTIRTSETPLPQPLYNPHLQAPLGSAGNKGLITPLESALTKNSPASLL